MLELILTARELLTVAALVIFGGVYLSFSIPFLWRHYRKQEKRKRKGRAHEQNYP